ncbi:MAG: hypothetical protein RBT34_03205 [Anaerolineaceae bacterium]|nr:hypothetical protein [Anaerolineaceae bacterium]
MATDQSITPKRDSIFHKAAVYLRLIWLLMLDPRVSPFLKILPIGSLLYLFLPDVVPTMVDDGLVLGLGIYLFIILCPQDVVQEHLEAMKNRVEPTAETSAEG